MSNIRMPLSLRSPLLAPMAAALVFGSPAYADAVDSGSEIIVTGIRTATNPNADAAAAYKVDRSA